MKVKILVGYYKKCPLFESDVIVPIHCGRKVAAQKTRYGAVKKEDLDWLLNNMIGDDTGDNISELNRDLDEITGIYWAWKNYDKLGNPDYIGLYHYRRFLNLSSLSQISCSGSPIDRTGNNISNIEKILSEYDFVCRQGIPAKQAPYISFEPYQPIVGLSESYHPRINFGYQQFLKEGKFYANDIFLMRKEDFFDMCRECFPVLSDVMKIDRNKMVSVWYEWMKNNMDQETIERITQRIENNQGWYPALTGYLMEYIFSFYFSWLKTNRKSVECDVVDPGFIKKIPFYSKIFSCRNEYIDGFKRKVLTLFGFKFVIK